MTSYRLKKLKIKKDLHKMDLEIMYHFMKLMPRIVLVFFLVWCCYTIPASIADQAAVKRWVQSIETEDILFNSSTSELSEESREQLNLVSSKLAQLYGDFVVEVTGHTDDTGDADDNLRLSHLRALSVVGYLSQKNLHHHRFMVQSKGEFHPTVSNVTEEGRAQNRRVEIRVIPAGENTVSLITDPSEEVQEISLLAEAAPAQEPEVISDEQESVEEENLDQIQEGQDVIQEEVMTETIEETVVEPSETVQEKIQEEPAPKKKKVKESDYFVSYKKEQKWTKHPYDVRKKPGTGTIYLFAGPQWNRLSKLDDLGQTDSNYMSNISFYGGAGWTSFLEDEEDVFVTLEGFAMYERFDASTSAGLTSSQSDLSYGGHVFVGKYIFDNWSIGARVGFSSEAYLKPSGANLDYDTDFIGNAGAETEFVAWRFSKNGDVGLQANVLYYNVPLGDLDAGWRYGGGIFADYCRYRLTLDYQYTDFEALGISTKYSRFATYLSAYF